MVNTEILPNGIRIITEAVSHVQSAAIGIWVGSGACDEVADNRGISHFIEHMLFKGTLKRTAEQIATEFDSIGGQLNALTEKECTCYYAKVLSEHLPVAVDVLSDMLLNSQLDPKEIELEKNVILEEVKMHEDTPEDFVHDMFAETAWARHPLGQSALGTREVVAAITREDMLKYMGNMYTPDNIIISVAGNFVHEEVTALIASYFGDIKGSRIRPVRTVPPFYSATKYADKSTEQVQFCLGTRGFSHLDDNRYALAIIDATLGGGMSSRLFQEIREKRGLAYNIGSYSSSYHDGGLFTVYGGTSLDTIDEVLGLVVSEFTSVRKSNITPVELNRAKNQIKGALVLSLEGMSSRMIRLGRSELCYGRVVPMDELIDSLQKVTHDDIQRVAEDIFAESAFTTVAVGPFSTRKVEMFQ